MKVTKKKEQFKIANVLFEMGLDFDVIETISGVTAQELLLNKINMIDFIDETSNNKMAQSENDNFPIENEQKDEKIE